MSIQCTIRYIAAGWIIHTLVALSLLGELGEIDSIFVAHFVEGTGEV